MEPATSRRRLPAGRQQIRPRHPMPGTRGSSSCPPRCLRKPAASGRTTAADSTSLPGVEVVLETDGGRGTGAVTSPALSGIGEAEAGARGARLNAELPRRMVYEEVD